MVALAIEKFGNYMGYTKAMTDADQARLETIRADHMRNDDLALQRRSHARREEQAGYQCRNLSAFGDEPPRGPMTRNTWGEERRRSRDQMSSARATRQKESALTSLSETPAGNPRIRVHAGSQRGPSISGRAPAMLQRHEQRPRYDLDDGYEDEDEFVEEGEFKVPDRGSKNRTGAGSIKDADYDDPDELMAGRAPNDFAQADELDYDD
ncbi:AAA family [Fusarium beomiforme]|uniref:AAA family n=1 Tax=Fusarium beomiforme TaxID=44412 RepID=A0A9P5AAW4_9HYPO|nr:AAA family [Fusarium beomiforme]